MLYAWNFDINEDLPAVKGRLGHGRLTRSLSMDANPFLVADQKRREATGTRSARDGAIARTRKRRSLTHTGSFHARRAAAGASAESEGGGGHGGGGKLSFMSRIREEVSITLI